jgi:hypothetical protein
MSRYGRRHRKGSGRPAKLPRSAEDAVARLEQLTRHWLSSVKLMIAKKQLTGKTAMRAKEAAEALGRCLD